MTSEEIKRLVEYVRHLEDNTREDYEDWGDFDDIKAVIEAHEREATRIAMRSAERYWEDTAENVEKNNAVLAWLRAAKGWVDINGS